MSDEVTLLESRICCVDMFRRPGALVTRRAELPPLAAAGPGQWFRVPGLPACLDDGSVRVGLTGGGAGGWSVMDLRVEVELAGRDGIRASRRELRLLGDEITAAISRIAGRTTDLETLLGQARKALVLRLEGSGCGGCDGGAGLELSYLVPGARWLPEYELRVASGEADAELVLRALVGQRTGADWPGVDLRFSTADLLRSADLPEQDSWRIGKAQPPRATGWRDLPDSTGELFEAHDRGLRPVPPPASQPLLRAGADLAASLARGPGRSPSRVSVSDSDEGEDQEDRGRLIVGGRRYTLDLAPGQERRLELCFRVSRPGSMSWNG